MASTSQNTFAEGQSTNRPPFFDGSNYGYWKMRMQNFLIATDYQLWLNIKNGRNVTNTEDAYTAEDILKIQRDAKAKNCLYCALSPSEFEKISACDTAKDIWDKLQVAHEGTNQVKETRINILVHEYESFNMKDNESVTDMFGRFQKITNSLKGLGEAYSEPKLVKKILRSLPKQWMPKVTAIQEAKDLDKMSVEELMGSLMTHEVLMKQNTPDEHIRGRKITALRVESEEDDSQSEASSNDEQNEDEEMAMLTRKFKTFMKRRRAGGPFNKNKDKKKSVPTCYNCKKLGHLQYDCPEPDKSKRIEEPRKRYKNYFEKKEGNNSRPNRKFEKKKKAMAAWDMLEEIINHSSSETEEESQLEAQVCMMRDHAEHSTGLSFMAIHEDEVTDQLNASELDEILSELYADFKALKAKHNETAKELNRMKLECLKLQAENEKLKMNQTVLKELELVKAENEALRNTLTSTLFKLKPKVKGGNNYPSKRRQWNKGNTKPKQNVKQIWVPKSVAAEVNVDQLEFKSFTVPKKRWVPKFSATNPPGPTPKWVPKLKN